jgi:hypothetical protein
LHSSTFELCQYSKLLSTIPLHKPSAHSTAPDKNFLSLFDFTIIIIKTFVKHCPLLPSTLKRSFVLRPFAFFEMFQKEREREKHASPTITRNAFNLSFDTFHSPSPSLSSYSLSLSLSLSLPLNNNRESAAICSQHPISSSKPLSLFVHRHHHHHLSFLIFPSQPLCLSKQQDLFAHINQEIHKNFELNQTLFNSQLGKTRPRVLFPPSRTTSS